MPERRLERRLLCADLMRVEWRVAAGRGRAVARKADALLEDISRSGACLQIDMEIPVGVRIKLYHGDKVLEGSVLYCEFREIGYFVGVAFTGEQHWSKRMFRPKHILDPSELETPAKAT